MTAPTERQVLYGLVAAAWLVVVAVLAGAAVAVGWSPVGWSLAFAVIWAVAAVWAIRNWRATGRLLLVSVAVFAVWAVGALLTR